MFQNQNANPNPNSNSNPMASTSQPMVNNKTNAAGLLPEISKALPTRQPEADELIVLKALQGLYTSQVSEETLEAFSDQVIFTLPTGEVAVGKQGIANKLHEMCSAFPSRTFSQNLLTLPPSTNLPPRTMAIDQFVKIFSGEGELVAEIQSLLVIKRSAKDGKVLSISEEEGHRKATVPLAARAAAAANFYSPTDNMVSPTTSKLNLAKKKHHMKGKPTSLFGSPSSTSGTPSASSTRQPSRLASSTMDDDMSF